MSAMQAASAASRSWVQGRLRETAAAKRLRISKAVVSKQLQLLEVELGVNLVIRSSRHLNLTEAGQTFFDAERASVT